MIGTVKGMPSICLMIGLAIGLTTEASFAKKGIMPMRFGRFPGVHRTSNAALGSSKLVYYGGPVITNARVVTVFWGRNVNPALQQNLGAFYAAAVDSTQFDWLDQYGTFGKAVDGRPGTNQHIGRGSYVGEYVINPTHMSTSLDDKDIQAEIAQQIASNALPAADANTVYMIHFPAGVSITIEGMKSCQNFCAYHNASGAPLRARFGSAGAFYYGVMPDYGFGACSFGCGMGGNVFDTTTAISSHELTEAVTDPFPTPGDKPAYPQAWNTVGGEEIADLCPYGSAPLQTSKGNYKMSQEWDNQTNACTAGPFQSRH